jgi:hypothetical protein
MRSAKFWIRRAPVSILSARQLDTAGFRLAREAWKRRTLLREAMEEFGHIGHHTPLVGYRHIAQIFHLQEALLDQ